MDGLKISLGEVMECASRIRSCNQQMYDELNSMKKEMNSTNTAWISDGGEAIRAKFNLFASRFETEKETIDSYAAFLDRTAESYDTLETTITSNAQSMQV